MANRVEILVEVDPTGKGSAAIKSITTQVQGVSTATQGVADSGSLLGAVFGGNLLYNFFRQGTDAAIAFGKESVAAYAEVVKDQRFLLSQIDETGVSFDATLKKVDEFDEKLTLTRQNAEKLYAVSLQFTNEVGRAAQTDSFINKLSDLLVSHGVSPEEEANIVRSLLAGRATELGKVLGKNVATLEKEAAKAGGYGDFAKLDDSTKKLLLFNEVMQLSEKYTGATEQRLKEADGTLAALGATVDRAKESFGRFLTEESLVGDALRLLLGISPEQHEQDKLDAAGKRAEAQAQRHYEEILRLGDLAHLQAELAKDPSRRFESADFFVASQNLSAEAEASIRAQAQEAAQVARDEILKLSQGEGDRAAAAALAKFGNAANTPEVDAQRVQAQRDAREAAERDNRERAAEAFGRTLSEAEVRGRLAAYDRLADTERNRFIKQYDDLFKDKHLDVITAQFAERQFQHIRNILPPEEQDKIAQGLNSIFVKFEKEALGYLKNVRKEAEGLFSTLAERYAGNDKNPFVKILTEAETEGKRLERTFGVLGDAVVAELQEIQRAYQQQKILALELDADLSAAAKRREAEALYQRRPGELLGQEKAQLDIVEARINAALKATEYEAKALNLTRYGAGNGGLDRKEIQDVDIQYKQYERLVALLKDIGGGELGRKSRGAVNEALVGLFEGLDPELQDKIARSKTGTRDVFAGAYRDRAAEQQKQVQDAIENARLLDEQISKAEEDVARIREYERAGLSTSEVDARILRRTDEIGKDNLSPELRAARYDALERDADRTLNAQREAIDATKRATESVDKLTAATDTLAQAVTNTSDRRVLIEILNRAKADVHDDLYGDLATTHVVNSSSK